MYNNIIIIIKEIFNNKTKTLQKDLNTVIKKYIKGEDNEIKKFYSYSAY